MDDQAPGYRALHPVRRLLGYVVVITLVVIDPASWPYLVALFGVSVLFGQLQSMLALLIEETGFRRYWAGGNDALARLGSPRDRLVSAAARAVAHVGDGRNPFRPKARLGTNPGAGP